MQPSDRIKGVILAGGPSKGTRFRPLSLYLPKALFPLAGLPMIEHHIDALCRIPGLCEIIILGLYDPEVFRAYLEEKSKSLALLSTHPVPIRYLKEPGALGTAGGLLHFHDEIVKDDPCFFYFLHADICSPFPLLGLLEAHKQNVRKYGAICTMTGHQCTQDRGSSLQYGCIVHDGDTDKVIHYVEKPDTFISNLINCGIYIFQADGIFRVLKERISQRVPAEADPDDLILDKTFTSCLDIQSGTNSSLSSSRGSIYKSHMHNRSNSIGRLAVKEYHLSLEQDVLVPLCDKSKLFVFETKGFWYQIKTSESTLVANRLYLDHYAQIGRQNDRIACSNESTPSNVSKEPFKLISPSVYIHPNTVVHESSKIGPNVSIGEGCIIGKGVRLRDCIVLSNVIVNDFVYIHDSIIGWDSQIGMWSRIEGKSEDIVTHKRPSVTILAGDVLVHPEVMLRQCIVLPHKELKANFHDEIIM